LHLHAIGELYRRFFNRISRHYHCDDPRMWQSRLETAGFAIDDWWHYFSPRSQRVLEWGHYIGLPSLVTRKLFGKWIIAPWKWSLYFTNLITRSCYTEDSVQVDGVYTFYIARKI
jgi:hypothetical protein